MVLPSYGGFAYTLPSRVGGGVQAVLLQSPVSSEGLVDGQASSFREER